MKKLLFFVAVLINSAFVYSQKAVTQDSNGNIELDNGTEVRLGRYLSDGFGYNGTSMSHYAIKWGAEKGNSIGPSLWFSGYAGMKFFTNGSSRFSITHEGNVGIGIENPENTLDVNGHTNLRGDLFLPSGEISWNKNDKFAYQNSTFGHYALGWKNDALTAGGPVLWMSGYAGMKFFTNGTSRFSISHEGNVGIGTENPQNKLDVAGVIHAQEVRVDMEGWADYVFDADYNLPSLQEVKAHIDEHKHLPGIPSQEAVLENGVNMGEMQVKLLQKVEELTLYVIQQQEEINTLKAKLENK